MVFNLLPFCQDRCTMSFQTGTSQARFPFVGCPGQTLACPFLHTLGKPSACHSGHNGPVFQQSQETLFKPNHTQKTKYTIYWWPSNHPGLRDTDLRSQPSAFTFTDSQPPADPSTWVGTVWVNPDISGPVQFKPMLFMGHLYRKWWVSSGINGEVSQLGSGHKTDCLSYQLWGRREGGMTWFIILSNTFLRLGLLG